MADIDMEKTFDASIKCQTLVICLESMYHAILQAHDIDEPCDASFYHLDGNIALKLFQAIIPEITALEITPNSVIAYMKGDKWFQLARHGKHTVFLDALREGIWQ